MAHPSIVAAVFLCGVLLVRWIRGILLERERRRQISLHGCQPAKTLSRNSWYFGLDVAYEMATSYDNGSRNTELSDKFKAHGPTFRTTAAGSNRIFTIDPANVKAVFGEKSDDWGVAPVRHEAFKPLIAGGVLVTDGNEWRHARTIAQAIVDRIHRRYSTDLGEFDDAMQSLIKRLPRDGSTVDLQPLFYQYTVDSSTENIFGKRIGALNPGPDGDQGRQFLDAFIYCLKMAGERDEVPQWTYFVLDSKFRSSCRIVHQYVDEHIDQALEICIGKEPGSDFSSEWAQSGVDRTEARNQILNVIAASFDTIAILLTNTYFHLARNPECYAKLRGEVENFEPPLDGGNIKSLRYLHFVLNETLRLNGPASFNSRVALTDKIIPHGGGPDGSAPVFVPKGDNVIVSAFALQRRAEVFGPEPDEFRPERWEDIKPKHWDFVPFSGGQRVCPGQKFALLHAAYAVFRLVKEFRTIENRDPVLEFVEEYRVATGSKSGALVSLQPE